MADGEVIGTTSTGEPILSGSKGGYDANGVAASDAQQDAHSALRAKIAQMESARSGATGTAPNPSGKPPQQGNSGASVSNAVSTLNGVPPVKETSGTQGAAAKIASGSDGLPPNASDFASLGGFAAATKAYKSKQSKPSGQSQALGDALRSGGQ